MISFLLFILVESILLFMSNHFMKDAEYFLGFISIITLTMVLGIYISYAVRILGDV